MKLFTSEFILSCFKKLYPESIKHFQKYKNAPATECSCGSKLEHVDEIEADLCFNCQDSEDRGVRKKLTYEQEDLINKPTGENK